MKIYDCIIIGAGPAGLSAGIYLARKKIDCLVLSKDLGGQAALPFSIENYPGFKSISGADLIKKIEEQLLGFGTKVQYEELKSIKKDGKNFKIKTDQGEYEAKVVIITAGKLPNKLGVPGEDKFEGAGVAYCATCDAPLFKDKAVAVVGGGNAALDSVLQLSKYTNKIYLLNLTENLTGDPVMVEKVENLGFVNIFNDNKVLAILGENAVEGLEYEELKTKKQKKIDVSGVIVEIGSHPSTGFEAFGLKLNKRGEIVIDKNNKTSIPGIFAAGDITDIRDKHIVIASGEGAKAAISVYEYLK